MTDKTRLDFELEDATSGKVSRLDMELEKVTEEDMVIEEDASDS